MQNQPSDYAVAHLNSTAIGSNMQPNGQLNNGWGTSKDNSNEPRAPKELKVIR
jgi:hypothetical protein